MGRYLDLLKNVQATPKPEPATNYRHLCPDELAKLTLTLRITAPSGADSWSLADWLTWIEERASILEFDGERSPQQADQEALLLCNLYRQKRQT